METLQFSCGVDIGVKNLAISFVEILLPRGATSGDPGDDDEDVGRSGETETRIISYKGTMESIVRFSEGEEIQTLKIEGKKVSHHDSYIMIFEAIPEFKYTVTTIIEMQLAMNRSDMSRLDGVAYGFLRGRYPEMTVTLNGSTIRKKFITDFLGGIDPTTIPIPRGYPPAKHPSFMFVATKFPSYYKFIQLMEGQGHLDKIDDVSDSVVYSCIAFFNYSNEGKVKRKAKGRKARA